MSDTTLVSITLKKDGLEIIVADAAYDNLAVIGAIEKVKFLLLNTELETTIPENLNSIKYDA